MNKDALSNQKKGAIFFDRDGVINEPPSAEDRYLRRWEDFRFTEGIVDVLARVKQRGWLIVLITNQQGVGKGLMSVGELESIHQPMQACLRESRAAFDAIYAAIGLRGEDPRRKPSPAMLLEAAQSLDIDLGCSWMVGDHDNDMRAGQAAGTKTIRFLGEKAVTVASDHHVEDAAELGRVLEKVLS